MGLLTKSRQSKALNTNLSYTLIGNTWLTPDDNSSTYIDKGYKALPNLYGIISLITQKSSLPPFQVMREKNVAAARKYKAMIKSVNVKTNIPKLMKLKEEAFEAVDGSELEALLSNPNPDQSIEELNEAFDGYNLITGNSYFYGQTPGVGKNGSKIKELYVLPSPTVEPIAEGMKITKYKVSYYKDHIDSELIGHAKMFNPINGLEMPSNQLKGMSPLLSCRNLLGRYMSADIAQGAMFKNMGPVGIINGENGDLTEVQAQSVKDTFNQKHVGAYKAGNFVVTPARLHWTQIGLSPVDLNTIAGKKEILGELCNVYHVPIGIFSDENSTDNNMDNSRKILITDAVIPACERRKAVINRWLAPKCDNGKYFIEYDYTVFEELQEDMEAKVNWLMKAWSLTPNEVRQELGVDELADPNMNKVYMPSGYITMNDANMEVEEVDEELLNEAGISDV